MTTRWQDDPASFLAVATGEGLDALYNNRLRVPAFPSIVSGWQARSAAFRHAELQAGRCQMDLAYGSGHAETLDVFHPGQGGAKANGPVLMFIHGGYWRSLDKADHSFVAEPYLAAGHTVVVPNYALCPGTPDAPVTVELIALQMARALAWVRRELHRPVLVAGHSAGGHLVAQLMTCRWAELDATLPPKVLVGGVAISGLFELASVQRTPYLNTDLHLTDSAVPRLSPAWMPAPRGAGPLYALVGGEESPAFQAQNLLIQKAWGEQAVPVCEALEGLNHFTVLEAFATPGHRAFELTRSALSAAD